MNQITDSEHLLSALRADTRVAVTAPFIRDNEVLVGYAPNPEESYCVVVPLEKFIALCPSLYYEHMFTVAYHGLKRIWEFLDDRGLRPERHEDKALDINKIEDTKLMAYLLDPDLGRELEFGDYRVQEGLTLANLSARYLGEDYPYRNTDIHADRSTEVLASALAYDARIIHRLAAEMRGLMSEELHKLYRDLELPLMLVLDEMRRVGIGVDGAACAQERDRMEQEMSRLAQEITGGAEVDLRSDRDVYRFLVARGVQFLDPTVHQWGKVSNTILEETASHYPWVQKILGFREMGQDLSFLRHAAAGRDRVHPVWGQTRSATSRICARNPAVQNVSRDLRHLFLPAAGHVLIKADYSQAQMRILAHLSRDAELMRIFRDPNGDVHTETSKLLALNDRDVAKEINFGMCFGMTPVGLCRKINDLKERRGRRTSSTWRRH
ncbi:DNA polymerase [Thermodesulfobacteriota bacterium]